MNQKILLTLTVVSLSFTAFLGGYLISQKDFHRNSDSMSTGNILDKFSDDNHNTNPQTGESIGNIRLLSPRNVISPTLSKEKDSIVYYEKNTGKVFEITLKGLQERLVSDVPLVNLIKTIWSPSRKEVVSFFYYPSGGHYKYFNYKTRTSIDLGTDIKSLSFSPDGSQIAYFGTENDSRGIFISQPDGSSSKKILPSRLENAEVYWPSNEFLSFKTYTANGSELYSLSKNGEVKKILETGDSLEIKWSKDDSVVLFSKKTESGVSLFYKNIFSDLETPLNVSTRASKCDWSIDGETVVCGVPKLSAPGDDIYEISLDGTQKLLSSPTTRINTAELFISGLDDYVVILNSLDDKLYVLKK